MVIPKLMAGMFERYNYLRAPELAVRIGYAATPQLDWDHVVAIEASNAETAAPNNGEPVVFPPDGAKDVPLKAIRDTTNWFSAASYYATLAHYNGGYITEAKPVIYEMNNGKAILH